jgi:hypothetical protein
MKEAMGAQTLLDKGEQEHTFLANETQGQQEICEFYTTRPSRFWRSAAKRRSPSGRNRGP